MPATSEARTRADQSNALAQGPTGKVLRTEAEVEALSEPTPPPPGTSPLARDWVANEVQLLALRVERAGLMELKLRERSALRASICWDADQRHEAEVLGSKIRKDPAKVVAGLEATPQGCRWMIERWAMIARAADLEGGWSPAVHELAFDLLGTPIELRLGPAYQQLNAEGEVIDADCGPGEFARRNVDRLFLIQDKLAGSDAFDRAAAEAGLAPDLGAAGHRLSRYEAELQRRLKWYHQLLDRMPEGESAPAVEVAEVEPGPETAEGPSDAVTRPSRQEYRALRVERRRLAAERKLARRLE